MGTAEGVQRGHEGWADRRVARCSGSVSISIIIMVVAVVVLCLTRIGANVDSSECRFALRVFLKGLSVKTDAGVSKVLRKRQLNRCYGSACLTLSNGLSRFPSILLSYLINI